MKKTLLMAALLLSSAALATPYKYPAEATTNKPSEVKMGGVLRLVQLKDFDTYNPFTTQGRPNIPELMGYAGIGNTLIAPKLDNLSEYEGIMAENFAVAKDNRTYTFNLRPELKWSDGKPIVADDFITALTINATKDVEASLYDYMYDNGKPVTWKKLGERSFSITFPRATVQNTETVGYFFPVPTSVFGGNKTAEQIKALWDITTDPSTLIAPGPFVPSKYVKGERLTMVKNKYYGDAVKDSAGRSVPYLDGLQYNIIADQNAELAQFLAGNTDVYQPNNRDKLAQITAAKNDKKLDITVLPNIGPNTSSDFLYFNWNKSSDPTKQTLFRNTKFRQAMNMLVNKDAMLDLALGGLGQAAWTSVYPVYKDWVAPNVDKFKFNPTAAAKLLDEIGYSKKGADGIRVDGKGSKLSFTLLTNSENTRRQALAKIFQEEAKKAGVEVKTNFIPFNQLLDTVYPKEGPKTDRKFDVAITGVGGGGFINPVGVAAMLRPGGDLNGYNYTDKAIQPWETQMYNLFIKSTGEFDLAKRKEIANQIQKLQVDNIGYIYLLSQNIHNAWDNRVQGEYPKKYQTPLLNSSYFGVRNIDLTWLSK